MPWQLLALASLAASPVMAKVESSFQVSVETYATPTASAVGYEVPAGENFAFYTGWEHGDDVTLAAGAGVIASFNFEYYANYALTDGWTVRIYEKDAVSGQPGRQLDTRSGDILSGGAVTRIEFGYLATNVLPANFIYSLQFSGIGAGKVAGLIVPNRRATTGTSDPGFLINTTRGWESAHITSDGTGDGDLQIVVPPTAPAGPIPLGQNVSLSVGATGRGPLVFQWRWNGVVIPGANSATLDLGTLRAQQGGYYEVAVSDGTGVVFSDPVTVQPDVPVLPFTDSFSRAVSNSAQIEGLTGTGRGANLLATAENGEPAHGPLPAHASLWLSWRPEASGVATFSTLGSDFDTVLAIYQQPPFGAKGFPGLVRIAANDQSVAFSHASEVQFNVIAGSTYLVVVDGKSSLDRGGRGRVMLSWDTELTPDRLPIASQSAPRVAVAPNEPVRMETQVSLPTGSTAVIRWYRLMPDGALFSGVVGDSLSLPGLDEASVGRYFAEALVTYPNGNTRLVRVGLFDIQMRLGDNEGDQVLAWDTFSLSRANVPTQAGVANRSRIQRSGLSRGTSGTQVFSSVGSTREDGEPATCGVVGAATSWYALQAEADGPISVNTVGSNFDTVIAVYTDTGEGPGLFDGLRPVTCNDNASATVTSSAVQFCARAGTVYFIQVDGVGGAVGTVKLNFSMANDNSTCELAASECQQGTALHVLPSNGQLVLAPEILNQPPYTLEWMHEGQVIAGKKEPVLQLAGPQSGDYAMRLTSRFGQTVRPVAKVRTVNPGETGTGFVWLCDGRLRLLPAGSPNQRLVLERSADLTNWTPIQTNAPANGTFEFVVPAAEQEQSAVYRVRPQ